MTKISGRWNYIQSSIGCAATCRSLHFHRLHSQNPPPSGAGTILLLIMASLNVASSAFQKCPPELLDLIFGYCTLPSLRDLAATSQAFKTLTALPLRYRRLTLGSIHASTFEPLVALAKSQQDFVNTAVSDPHIPSLVQQLTWLVCDVIPVHSGPKLWELLHSMKNVTSLDFSMRLKSHDDETLRNPPAPLFPAATSIKLSGVIYRHVVLAVLHPDVLATIEDLTMDDVQDPGHVGGRYLWTRDLHPPTTSLGPEDAEDLTVAGHMRGVLPQLER